LDAASNKKTYNHRGGTSIGNLDKKERGTLSRHDIKNTRREMSLLTKLGSQACPQERARKGKDLLSRKSGEKIADPPRGNTEQRGWSSLRASETFLRRSQMRTIKKY